MAFAIQKDTEIGVKASYWRITFVRLDYLSEEMQVHLDGYASKAAKDAGARPIQTTIIMGRNLKRFAGVDLPFMPDATRADLYKAIKKIPTWTGALDG